MKSNKILLVDDENTFRLALADRLRRRGYTVVELERGAEALKTARTDSDIDVVVLDRKMPDADGEQVLKELKQYRPELQVIMLTAHGSLSSAMTSGKLEAYAYLQKPCDFEQLIATLEMARQDKPRLHHRLEVPLQPRGSWWSKLKGVENSRPLVIGLGVVAFVLLAYGAIPERMLELSGSVKQGETGDPIMGYAAYKKMKVGETIASYYSAKYELGITLGEGQKKQPLSPEQVARRGMIMLGILVLCALFWATGAMPVGVTALVVGGLMYLFEIFKPDTIAAAYAKDAVIFIFCVLALTKAISKTGLDRRIGILLLGTSTSLPRVMFLFLPMVGMACSFLSEHAIVAFLMPILILVYVAGTRGTGGNRNLAVMLVLALTFTANLGGPGSPAAGGRNAIMQGILADYCTAPSFGQWVKYGLPFVPVAALSIGAYFYLVFWRRLRGLKVNAADYVREASRRIGPMTRDEVITAVILVLLVSMWIAISDDNGMGGPAIVAVVLLNLFRILTWRDIASIHWEVVALYASACALGKGLAETGGALYLADQFVAILPEAMKSGPGLAIAASLFTGISTNFMSDGATVSMLGPITVPMAIIADTHPWMVGLATAFASSFAHMFLVGTPNNAIAYAMAKDPITGEQLVTIKDFLIHGFAALLISFTLLWGWVILGYWSWLGFPS
ncbi:MAG: histidine kinase [Deltaproteobacteria bacterium RIFOXYA12_FULL_61_11]|nr:MAG: histidine kinase [Deltaproteobacteria bacterium RIFOXYA12_FULL_61_11]